MEESETNGDLEVLHPEFNCEADKEMIYDKTKIEASKREREREREREFKRTYQLNSQKGIQLLTEKANILLYYCLLMHQF